MSAVRMRIAAQFAAEQAHRAPPVDAGIKTFCECVGVQHVVRSWLLVSHVLVEVGWGRGCLFGVVPDDGGCCLVTESARVIFYFDSNSDNKLSFLQHLTHSCFQTTIAIKTFFAAFYPQLFANNVDSNRP